MEVGDEIISKEGEVAQVHIVLGDEVVGKNKAGKLFTFKLDAGLWSPFKSMLLQYKSDVDGLTVQELQDKLLALRNNKAKARISPIKSKQRIQSLPAMSKEDKGILALIKNLNPAKIKELKNKMRIS